MNGLKMAMNGSYKRLLVPNIYDKISLSASPDKVRCNENPID